MAEDGRNDMFSQLRSDRTARKRPQCMNKPCALSAQRDGSVRWARTFGPGRWALGHGRLTVGNRCQNFIGGEWKESIVPGLQTDLRAEGPLHVGCSTERRKPNTLPVVEHKAHDRNSMTVTPGMSREISSVPGSCGQAGHAVIPIPRLMIYIRFQDGAIYL